MLHISLSLTESKKDPYEERKMIFEIVGNQKFKINKVLKGVRK